MRSVARNGLFIALIGAACASGAWADEQSVLLYSDQSPGVRGMEYLIARDWLLDGRPVLVKHELGAFVEALRKGAFEEVWVLMRNQPPPPRLQAALERYATETGGLIGIYLWDPAGARIKPDMLVFGPDVIAAWGGGKTQINYPTPLLDSETGKPVFRAQRDGLVWPDFVGLELPQPHVLPGPIWDLPSDPNISAAGRLTKADCQALLLRDSATPMCMLDARIARGRPTAGTADDVERDIRSTLAASERLTKRMGAARDRYDRLIKFTTEPLPEADK